MQPVPSSGGSGIDTGLRGQCLFGALHSLWSNRVTHKMIRLIACGLGLAGFGVIIAEVINNAQFLGIPYLWWGVIKKLAMMANE